MEKKSGYFLNQSVKSTIQSDIGEILLSFDDICHLGLILDKKIEFLIEIDIKTQIKKVKEGIYKEIEFESNRETEVKQSQGEYE